MEKCNYLFAMSECTSHLGLEWSQVTKSLMTTACVKQKKEDLLTQMADMLRNIYYWAQGTGGVCVCVCVCVCIPTSPPLADISFGFL